MTGLFTTRRILTALMPIAALLAPVPAPAQTFDVPPPSTAPATLTATAASTAPLALGDPLVTSPTLALLRSIEAAHASVDTIHATFDQVRFDQLMLDEIESPGELWYRKPYPFRADYSNPDEMITLILQDRFLIYTRELNQVDYWVFESDEERQQQLHELAFGFGFDTDELVRLYEIRSSVDDAALREELAREQDADGKHLLLFVPRQAYMDSSQFLRLKLYVDKETLLPEKIWYEDINDATMTLTMKQIQTNVPIGNDRFDPDQVIPAGASYFDKRTTL